MDLTNSAVPPLEPRDFVPAYFPTNSAVPEPPLAPKDFVAPAEDLPLTPKDFVALAEDLPLAPEDSAAPTSGDQPTEPSFPLVQTLEVRLLANSAALAMDQTNLLVQVEIEIRIKIEIQVNVAFLTSVREKASPPSLEGPCPAVVVQVPNLEEEVAWNSLNAVLVREGLTYFFALAPRLVGTAERNSLVPEVKSVDIDFEEERNFVLKAVVVLDLVSSLEALDIVSFVVVGQENEDLDSLTGQEMEDFEKLVDDLSSMFVVLDLIRALFYPAEGPQVPFLPKKKISFYFQYYFIPGQYLNNLNNFILLQILSFIVPIF